MTWWIVGGAAFVLWAVALRRPRVQAWLRDLTQARRCPTCGASIRADAEICPACHTTSAPLPIVSGRAALKQLQLKQLKREHEAFVDAYVADAGGREALGARALERAGATGLEWTPEQADAALDVWRIRWMRPAGFEQSVDEIVREARRNARFEWVPLFLVIYVFGWGGLVFGLSRLGVGAFTGAADGIELTPHGTAGYLWLVASLAIPVPVAAAVSWSGRTTKRPG